MNTKCSMGFVVLLSFWGGVMSVAAAQAIPAQLVGRWLTSAGGTVQSYEIRSDGQYRFVGGMNRGDTTPGSCRMQIEHEGHVRLCGNQIVFAAESSRHKVFSCDGDLLRTTEEAPDAKPMIWQVTYDGAPLLHLTSESVIVANTRYPGVTLRLAKQ